MKSMILMRHVFSREKMVNFTAFMGLTQREGQKIALCMSQTQDTKDWHHRRMVFIGKGSSMRAFYPSMARGW